MQLVIPGKWGSAVGIGRKENSVPVESSLLLNIYSDIAPCPVEPNKMYRLYYLITQTLDAIPDLSNESQKLSSHPRKDV